MEGGLKVLKFAARIAVTWTTLSLALTACWWLLLAVGRRFGSRPPPAREERQRNAEVRAIYADFCNDDGACDETLARSDPDETQESDTIVFMGWTPVQKR